MISEKKAKILKNIVNFYETLFSWEKLFQKRLLKIKTNNPAHNIFELYYILVTIRFTTSKRKLDI